MPVPAEFAAHLALGATSICRCWAVTRRDGARFGFTDHDRDVRFDGLVFRADTGLTGQAVQQTTGLSINNGEALGALSDASVTETDLAAGRFDDARVRAWLVNWQDPSQRHLIFEGSIGEVQTGGGGFRAELRGLTAQLNRPQGRVYQKQCTALLGDADCQFNLAGAPHVVTAQVAAVSGAQEFTVSGFGTYEEDWFARGKLDALDGAAAGLSAMIKSDAGIGATRRVRLWQELRAPLRVGDQVRLTVGCDKRAETCRKKFLNFINFRGFPHVPGEDWLTAYPRQADDNSGGSLER